MTKLISNRRLNNHFPRKSAFSPRESASAHCAIVHYHEIALKGKNRAFFENKLMENIKKALKGLGNFEVERLSGRLLIEYTDRHRRTYTDHNIGSNGIIKEKLERVFGIAYFSFAMTHRYTQIGKQPPQGGAAKGEPRQGREPRPDTYRGGIDADKFIEKLCEDILELIKDKKFKSFKIDAKRADKNFPMTSQEVNEKVGGYILKTLTGTDIKQTSTDRLGRSRNAVYVDLENPDLTVFIEVLSEEAFIYTEKIKGSGGLPVGTGGKVVSLISSGIDSPVASWNIMKRGARVVFVHFHSYPKTSRASIENVEKLIEILNHYQFESKLYLAPFLDIQKKILLKAPEKLRVVLYRRAMFKIAEEIARKEGARALVTGESLGQVASQTLENIEVISEAVKIPIFRPLIGQDKEEIIGLARKIGTYEISIRPYEDCCSLFTPKHPETKAKIGEVKIIEKNLALGHLIKKALKERELKIF